MTEVTKMRRITKVSWAVGGVALAAVFAIPLAHGEPDGPGGAPGHHMMGHGGPAERFAHMCSSSDARRAGLLAFAEVKLGITAAQKPAWDKFADKVKAAGAPMQKVCGELATAPKPKTLPERFARHEEIATAGAAELQALKPAVDEMYAQLTPAQKKTADEMMMHGPGMHGHGHGPGPGGPGMHPQEHP